MKSLNLSQPKLQFNIVNDEKNILYFQNKFLINDLHYFKVENISNGREIISTLLNSLNHYHNIACLTSFQNRNIQDNIFDIYSELIKQKYLENIDSLVEFFLEAFDFDFLWIEESDQILKSKWYKSFMQNLIDFNFHKTMPIIVIS